MSPHSTQASTLPSPPLRAVANESAAAPAPDFAVREANLREQMDGPCTYADWLRASRDLAQINRLTGAYRPTLDFLERVVAMRGVGYEPLHIVDVGCGHGDVLRRVAKWAARRSLPVRLTGIDLNPYAARGAKECDREERVPPGTATWLTADVFAAELSAPADVIISSLFTHHLAETEIVRFLSWSEDRSRYGWIVNDLRRSARAYRIFGWMCRIMPWHPFIRHDGPVSIRRAFIAEDWQRMLSAAGVHAEIAERGAARLCVQQLKSPDAFSETARTAPQPAPAEAPPA